MASTIEPNTSISHGTLNPRDLLPIFADVLEDLERDGPRVDVPDAADVLNDAERAIQADFEGFSDEWIVELVIELSDHLEHRAPEGTYFGSNEGDGSDFGFWAIPEDDDA